MSNQADQDSKLLGYVGLALAAVVVGSALSGRAPNRRPVASASRLPAHKDATVLAARRLNRAAGTLATSVLADSAVEHYRVSFKNRAIFTPLIGSALTLATSLHGAADMKPIAHRLRDAIYLLATA